MTLTIDERTVSAPQGKSVLETALDAGIYIPHLCYHPDLPSDDACKLCVVEIEGISGYPTSCTTRASNGLRIKTKSANINDLRQQAISEILAAHPPDCSTCIKYLNCELQALKQYFATDRLSINYHPKLLPVDASNPLFVFDPNKCVLCGRCMRACRDLRGVGILEYKKKGAETYIGTINGLALTESNCRFCGACAEVCPTGAILDKEELIKGKNRKSALVPCRYTCPAEIDVPGYVRFLRAGNPVAAAALIREKVPFPGVLSYVCDHLCEKACRRGELNQPVAIRELKRFALEQCGEGPYLQTPVSKPATGKKVAIIGSGPAGLTAAYYLRKQGHDVTVFEALPLAGGMLRYGIPAYRLPRHVLETEISLVKTIGVEVETRAHVDSIDQLFEQGFNAVLVAIGTQQGQRLPIPGAGNPSVLTGLDFLREVNSGLRTDSGQKVVVLGGGSVAFDCARAARRLGAGQVQIACLEAKDKMLAAAEEITQSEEEGIQVYPATTFTAILTEQDKISGVECFEVESFTFNEDNRAQVEIRPNSRFVLAADRVIFAIGQRPDVPVNFGLNLTDKGLVKIDPFTLNTNREGVFAAGDAVTGTASVIQAIAAGRKTAILIDRFLGGEGYIDEKLAPPLEIINNIGIQQGFAGLTRNNEFHVDPEKRTQTFSPVECGISENTALAESKRCLQCDLRLKIRPVKFWSEYQ